MQEVCILFTVYFILLFFFFIIGLKNYFNILSSTVLHIFLSYLKKKKKFLVDY